MKINILDTNKLIEYNGLKPITSPRLYSTKTTFDPEGILSNDIFGLSKGDRRGTFAYIDLKFPFLHPHVYGNVLKRMFRNISTIVSGQRRYSVVNGKLVADEEGWTGLQSLYDHWDEIDWNKSDSSAKRSKVLLSELTRDQVFINRILICPPAYRDVTPAGAGDTSAQVNELNPLYRNVISMVDLLVGGGLFMRTQYATQMKIQELLLSISNYFKEQISRKSGLIRRYLIGKSVDFGTRAVISSFPYNNETIQENMVDLEHTALPMAQCCSTFMPFVEAWLKNFFTREIINHPNLVHYYDREKKKEIVGRLKDPDVQFSDKVITKMIKDFVFNPDNRFKTINVDVVIPTQNGEKDINATMLLKGKKLFKGERSEELNRSMTVTDVIYMACVDICEKRHCMVTRYPVGTDKGLFFNKIRVQSTRRSHRVVFNEKEYPNYPDINFVIANDHVGVYFVDTAVFSNSFLDGLGGDYDGDMVSIRGIWTDEANLEAEEIMNRKMTALTITGQNSRVVSKEVVQSFYMLTKRMPGSKVVTLKDHEDYLGLDPDGFTRSKIISMIADTADASVSRQATRRKSRYNCWDSFNVPENYFWEGQAAIKTTLGSFLFNKYVLEGAGVIAITGFNNEILHKGSLGDVDDLIGQLYMEDKITRPQFNAYVDRRDNLGYWLNGMLAHTISEKMLKPLKKIEAKKRELYKKYEKELTAGDINVMTDIEKQLVDLAKQLLEGDPGMDLYLSGDLDFGNNYKNNAILKGPVKNKITNEFNFIGNAFMDGIEIKDVPAHANSILAGQYPTSIATKDSGYMGKKLLALLQMMEVDEQGTNCGTKALIPITITAKNKNDVMYTWIDNGGQLTLLDRSNITNFIDQTVMMRSPKSCISSGAICSKCAGELFYMLGVKQAGLFATQLSHSALNLALKAKHNSLVNLYSINPDTCLIAV